MPAIKEIFVSRDVRNRIDVKVSVRYFKTHVEEFFYFQIQTGGKESAFAGHSSVLQSVKYLLEAFLLI